VEKRRENTLIITLKINREYGLGWLKSGVKIVKRMTLEEEAVELMEESKKTLEDAKAIFRIWELRRRKENETCNVLVL